MNKIGKKRTLLRLETAAGAEKTYIYKLYISESSRVISYGLMLYSVKVELEDKYGKMRTAEITDAFFDREKALLFYEELVENRTPPENLSYEFEKANSKN